MSAYQDQQAQERMEKAVRAIDAAIAEMEAAGYGSHVLTAMQEARAMAQYALDEVRS